ncbi:MAG TPA: hypothetical protein VFB67_09065 [Candidatus Polarisedimenticolaceae bacterium]|nr:hypothetical protein [Candidatus Polarisedimenticolaceae bacterium]
MTRRLKLAVVLVVVGASLFGSTALADNGRGRNHCEIKCGPCTMLIDLTPKNKNDCRFICAAIPDCIPPA